MVLLVSCGDSNVSLIKDGTMNFNETVTIGDVLSTNACFSEVEWESKTNDRGQDVVIFTALVDNDALFESNPELKKEFTQQIEDTQLEIYCKIGFLLSKQDDSFSFGQSVVQYIYIDKNGEEKIQSFTYGMGVLKTLYGSKASWALSVDLYTWLSNN